MNNQLSPVSNSMLVSVNDEDSAAPRRQVSLSTAQEQALEWLTNGGSINEAAQYAGVARQTVYRWLSSDPDFREFYDQWRQHVVAVVDGQLMGLSDSAVAALAHAIRDRQDVRAAEFLIKHVTGINKRK